ncbi:thiol reductant ABC exporter subunit CydD [Saccharopolyspora sp. TS4A08]|uniref:Thiol reductant ABC exporter subunit CydD n=1 Tax=Saccharopolyspora ipomoeae TaxID=3042027 RepID=A0ABT6PXD5_9PSEU|nr:thiol reductant ABC exporter subunit CydD [Saccharopolyspora sp. TS4A08]MDI2032686.1 thiol reductant ABC exporter subunit CydD [Saccharopolyspora sp. TS4A08]
MSGPLGALPRLSGSTRRALVVGGLLAAGNAVALIAQAWAIGSALADVVVRGVPAAEIGDRLVVLAVAVLARAALGWATEAVSARAAAGAKEELRALLLDSALRRGPEWIGKRGPAELTALATRGLDALDAYFTKYLPALVTAAIVPPLVGAWILWSDWVSALVVVLTVPLIPLFAWLVGRYTEQRTARATDAEHRLSARLLELIRALPVLTAFGRARAQREVVRKVSEEHRRSTVATLRIAFLSALVLELFSSLSVAMVAVGIGLRLVSGDLDLATGLLVLVLAPECYLPLRAVGAAHHASEDGVEAVRRVDEIVSAPEPAGFAVTGNPDDEPGVLRVSGLRVRRRDAFVPDGLSFTARPGSVLRLASGDLGSGDIGSGDIGPSGSGKSTVLAVLLGFAHPDSGVVTCGGATPTVEEWRRRVAWVPQRPTFTGGTVRDELLVATADQPDLADHIDGTLADAAAGHLADRRIDELSAGERQRVAVARALLRLRGDATFLLLDEPTAHLDAASAQRVDAAVARAAQRGATVVLASHRPTSESTGPETAAPEVEAPGPAETTARGRLRDLIGTRTLAGAALGALSLLSGLALTATSAWLIARASQQPPILTLSVAVVGVRTFALSRAALRYLERLVTHDAAFRTAGDLRERLWSALVRIGPVRTAGLRRGEGVARLVDDVDEVRDQIPRVVLPPLIAFVVLVAAVVVQALVLPEAGLVLALALATASVATPVVAVLAEQRASAAVAEGRRVVAARVLALLDGAAELLAFGAHTRRRAELTEADSRLAARARRAAFGTGAATAVHTLLIGAAVLGSAHLAATAVSDGRLAPELAPLLALVPLAAAEAVALLPPAAQQWRTLRAAHDRLAPLLSAPEPDQRPAGTEGEIDLVGADIAWPDGPVVLSDVDLHVPAGSHVAVVGPSGAGKSTLLALLLGFVPAAGGFARVPDRVAWCPQDPQLVTTTVRENLRLAAPGATDAELTDALDTAGLPGWDLDTPVGSGGTELSGGEAQRLALARALLADADLVLLDEPTAHLDAETADALLHRLRDRLRGRTVVHVTHRISETAGSDLVLRVSGGRVDGSQVDGGRVRTTTTADVS